MAKRPTFNIYEFRLDERARSIRKTLRKDHGKHAINKRERSLGPEANREFLCSMVIADTLETVKRRYFPGAGDGLPGLQGISPESLYTRELPSGIDGGQIMQPVLDSLGQELYFAHKGYEIWFPEDEDLLQMLLSSTVKLRDSEEIDFPETRMSLAIPSGFKFKGYPLQPCIVSASPVASRALYVGRALGMASDMTLIPSIARNNAWSWTGEGSDLSKATQSMAGFIEEHATAEQLQASMGVNITVHPQAAYSGSFFNHLLPVNDIRRLLSLGPVRYWNSELRLNAVVPDTAEDDDIQVPPANEMEAGLFSIYCSAYLFFALSYYSDVFPEKIVPGMPLGARPGQQVMVPLKSTRTMKKSDIDKATYQEAAHRATHLRVGHFRTLESERYVNKKGQRVWVRPHIVRSRNAAPVEAVTVEGQEEARVTRFKPQTTE